ncbi:MAG TPA: AAA family ATPase [Acidimicrobiales bacterium]|nr:AAA family ATPase [Acidimicrobiales bacterium]
MVCPDCERPNRDGARFCDFCGASLDREATNAAIGPLPVSVSGGRYKVERLIGEGARKRVYAATDTRLAREVALAVVKTEGLDGPGRERIAREARAMAKLGDHPHIVTVFDVGDEDDQPFIVSQLMPGGSVAELLERAPDHRVPVDEALQIALEVARALDHAHGHGVVHRDLKPANVWRAADGTVLLGDFGLAATGDEARLTVDGLVVGTVAYLAPEQAVGRAPDARSDLYSLGALLYELLTGRPPFLGDDAVTVISQHLNSSPVAPSWHNATVSSALDTLVLALLAKDPSERPKDAASTIDELERIAIGALTAAGAPVAPTAAPKVLTSAPLAGRVPELGQLTAAFDHAVSGRSRLVMVVGEPGIGKTRLVEELAVYASVRGATVCWGHCYEGELGMPYLPFIEAFRTYVRERSDEDLRAELSTGAPEIATLVSELRARFSDLPSSPPLEGDAERMRLFEGVSAFVRNASVGRPLVLLLDDLHWADKPTLLMLQYLVRNLRRERVLIVGTYRDVELDRTHPLADAVAALRREQLYERVLLRGLSTDEVKELIDSVDNQDSPRPFAELVHRETEGNPFFVAEILRNLVETGAITRVDGQWVGTAEQVIENLPEGVREVIGRRLSRLSADCNRMLTVGAAMPGGFSLDVVSSVLELDDDRVLDLLDEALDAQVLRERREAPGTYEFNHALIRQTLYGELSTPRRVRLHRQIAATLEAQGASDTRVAELAYHCFHAAPGGDVARAVEYSTRAGDNARAQAAHEEAARFYKMALESLELGDAPAGVHRGELLLSMGSSLMLASEPEAAAAALDEAVAVAREFDDALLLGRTALVSGTSNWTGGIQQPKLVALLAEAVERIGDRDDSLRSRLLARQAASNMFIDQNHVATLSGEAVEAAKRSGDPGALAAALHIWTATLTGADQHEEARLVRTEIGRLAEQAGDLELAHQHQLSLLVGALLDSERQAMDAAVAGVAQLAQQSRSPFVLASAATVQATVAVLEGRYDDGDRFAAEVLTYGRRLRDRTMVNTFGVVVFPMWRERGRLAEFESVTARAVEQNPTVAGWRAGLAHLLCEIGKPEDAVVHVDVLATGGFSAIPSDVSRPYALCAVAEAVAALSDSATAEDLVALLRPHVGRAAILGLSAYHGAIDRYIGLLDMTAGRYDEAVDDLTAAMAIHERMRARPWIARTEYDLARALVARDTPGDRERAVSLLNRALETANSVGMPKLVEQALHVKLELQGVASSSPTASIDMVAAGVSMERPDLASHAADDGQVTLVFSDIAGYTALTERLGDELSQSVLHQHNAILRSELRRHRGVEVKSHGDGFMLAFTEPADGVAFATAIQRAVSSNEFDGERLELRIGIHVGKVIREEADFFGRTVILAARVADHACGGEVLATPEVLAAVRDVVAEPGRAVALKGLSGTHTVHAVAWRAT